ncbi:4Fe-4S dicluster domain-containing protein [Bacillaceae bacterium]
MAGKWIMLIDLDSCSGCHACSVSCKAEHRVPLGYYRHKVQYVEKGKFPEVKRKFIPTLCQHCTDAPCMAVCAAEAIVRTESGAVVIDREACVGAGACVEACPYGAIYLDPVTSQAFKCDFCHDRGKDGAQPACVSTCPTDAIVFGDENDQRVLQALEAGGYSRWEPEATAPRVWYKGWEPEWERRLERINRAKGGD